MMRTHSDEKQSMYICGEGGHQSARHHHVGGCCQDGKPNLSSAVKILQYQHKPSEK